MEKLTINLPPIEIARIDILVEAGYYPSRAEFIRSAIRKTLDTHHDFVSKKLETIALTSEGPADGEITSRVSGVGIYHLGKDTFERAIEQGKKLRINVVGVLNLDKDVTAEHVKKAVERARVYGIVRASPKVKDALQDKRPGSHEE